MFDSAMTDEQKVAVTVLDRPLALVAGAGSGKTTVLVQRYLNLLSQGLKPRQILTVTFTSDAAEQLRDRILARLKREDIASDELIRAVESTPYISTIHGFCYHILDQCGSNIGLKPIEKILSPFELASEFDSQYRSWLDALPQDTLVYLLDHYSFTEIRSVVRSLYDSRFLFRAASLQNTEGSNEKEILLIQKLSEIASPLLEHLENTFASQGAYSFDDLEYLTLRIFRESPEVSVKLQSEIKSLLIDEFQDTSRLQWEILSGVIGKQNQKLFVVGDPKQSIYSFRHAEVKLFLSVANEIEVEGGVVQELSANFRSDPLLLDSINQIASHLFQDSEIPFSPMRSGLAGSRSTESPFSVLRHPVLETRSESFREEIKTVVADIQRRIQAGASPEDFAILFRVSDRIPEYFSALSELGIPATCRKSTRLFECYDVIDLANYLKAVLNPLNDFALAAFLRSSFVGSKREDLWEITQRKGDSLLEKLMSDTPSHLKWFFNLIESGELDVQSVLQACVGNARYWPKESEAVLQFLSGLESMGLTVPEAVEKISTWEQENILFQSVQGSSPHHSVNLMTVHGAKGLEYPHVYLVDNLRTSPRRVTPLKFRPGNSVGLRYRLNGESVTSETYETISDSERKNELEESKRILYVGLTRARRTLTLSLPKNPSAAPKGTWGAILEEALEGSPK